MATCFLIDSPGAGTDSAAARFARLRGARIVRCKDSDNLPGAFTPDSLIAIGGGRFRELSGPRRSHLGNLVSAGATLYVRGLAPCAATIDLRPFAPLGLSLAREKRAVASRFTTSPLLPAALAGEEMSGGLFDAPGIERRSDVAGRLLQELLVVRDVDGVERTSVFAVRHGSGLVIHDLHPHDQWDNGTPIMARLADPGLRNRDVGALIAANRAAGIDPARRPPFDLVVDDRPVNFDHFNAGPIATLLRRISERCPGAHTDFAWTPSHTSPCRSYLEAMKRFPTGFVWHGLSRHVDHRVMQHPAVELADGRRMVARIERRFSIRLQPIMIFPFERTATTQFSMLASAGFLASVEEPRHLACSDGHFSGCDHEAQPAYADAASGFTVLYRYPASSLTRDRMLAMAALGLPIIAFAHPDDVGLRRFSRFWDRGGNASHFDAVLDFASSKSLPSRSLEDIATEVRRLETPGYGSVELQQATANP